VITFTEKAANKVLNIMQEQKVSDDTVVRVGVKGGGCSGFTYTVDFESRKGKFDLEFNSFGLGILCDKKSHIYIKDTEIDWSDNLNDRGLKFNNPSAKGSCGCRTSFMYEHTETKKDINPSWMGMNNADYL
jgi:iron-sulfur cluster assembly protein|tara:strand:- start:243 stop:635 length:393 start_codon:yes stop_codon:yes gene_type:complete